MATTTKGAVRVTGAKELRRAIRTAEGPGMKKELKAVYKKAGRVVEVRSKSLSPVKSGDLRNSIRTLSTTTKAVLAIGKGQTLDYAGRVIFGDPSRGVIRGLLSSGQKIDGNPFPHEALKDEWPQVAALFDDAIDDLGRTISTTKGGR